MRVCVNCKFHVFCTFFRTLKKRAKNSISGSNLKTRFFTFFQKREKREKVRFLSLFEIGSGILFVKIRLIFHFLRS